MTANPRMAELLADLSQACASLTPNAPQAVACPIFGNTSPPAAPSTAGLPRMLAGASIELARALREPPSLGHKWPFADPAGLVASRTARQAAERAKGGRPSQIKPHQVVRLVRFVNLGDSVRVAAGKAGMPERSARKVLAGQVDIAHHPAVTASGVFLPTKTPGQTPAKPRQGAERQAAATTPAPKATTPLKSPAFKTGGAVIPGPSVGSADGGVCSLSNATGRAPE